MVLFYTLIGNTIYAQNKDVVVIDQNYPDKESILASVPASVPILQVDDNVEVWNQLYTVLSEDLDINTVHLFLNTSSDNFKIGNLNISEEELRNDIDLQHLGTLESSGQDRSLFVYSCSLANNPSGIQFLETLGSTTNFNVLSAMNCSLISDEGFNFDYSSKNDLSTTNLILD